MKVGGDVGGAAEGRAAAKYISSSSEKRSEEGGVGYVQCRKFAELPSWAGECWWSGESR